MIILGIDPGTAVTGYGLISHEGKSSRALDYGAIRTDPSLSSFARYALIFNAIAEILESHTVSAIAVETQFVQKNIQSAFTLGRAMAAATLPASLRGIPIFEYAPRKAKLAVVGTGSASKEQVQKMVQILLSLSYPPEPLDAADALALALCHANSLKINNIR